MVHRKAAGAAVAIGLLLLVLLPSPMRGAPPVLPLAEDGLFVTGLAAPVLSPGGSGPLTFSVGDPLAVDLTAASLSLGIYAFNAYPGNATGPVPAGALALTNGGPTSLNLSIYFGTLVPGAPAPISINVRSASAAPSGTYAIRFALSFVVNGTGYLLESRGMFSDAAWRAATTGTNGSGTLNLSALGVSGILPETGVLVRSNPYDWALPALLGGALVLAAAGGYYAFRRGPRSRSGASSAGDDSQAPRAFGNSRTRDGD